MLKWIGKLWAKAGGKPLKRQSKTPADKEQTTEISEIKDVELGQDVLSDFSEFHRKEHVPRSHGICDINKHQWEEQKRSNSLAEKGGICANVKDSNGACNDDHRIKTLQGRAILCANGLRVFSSEGRDLEHEQIKRDSVVARNSDSKKHVAGNITLRNNEVTVSKVNHDEVKLLHSTSPKDAAEIAKYVLKFKYEYEEPKNIKENTGSVNEKETYLKAKKGVIKPSINTQKLNNLQINQTTVKKKLPYISQATNQSLSPVNETVLFETCNGNCKSVACINNLSADIGNIASRSEKVVNEIKPQHLVKISNNDISIKVQDNNIISAVIQRHVSVKTSEPQEKFSAITEGNISESPLPHDFTKVCNKAKASIFCNISDSSSSSIFLDPSSSMSNNNDPQHTMKCLNDTLSAEAHNVRDKEAEGLDLSLENLFDLSEGVKGLYNHEGDLCTIGNQRFIKTILQDSKKLVYVNTGVKEFSGLGTKLGCRVLWRDQSPIPLSTLKDGSKVKFDAIYMPVKKIYQALVIWEKTKPRYVTEPSTRSYIWIDSRVLTCEDVFTTSGSNCVMVQYDQKKVFANFSKALVFVDGKKANVSDLVALRASSVSPVYTTVNRLMTATKGTEFYYVCSCIWSGIVPAKDMKPSKMFEHGEIYRLNSHNEFVKDSSPCRLYCDWPSFLEVTEKKCTLTFEIENHQLSKPLGENKLYVGKFKAQPNLSLKVAVTAHIQKISEGHWMILQLHPPEKEKGHDVCASTSQTKAAVDSKAAKKTPEKVLPESNPALLQYSGKSIKHEQPPKPNSASAQKKRPQVINDVTGHIFCVKGDYGILKIRQREIAGNDELIAAFHRSVAYVDQWPLYKNIPFDIQIKDLKAPNWHCSLRICQKVIEGIQIEYEATLAWKGRKPTRDIIAFYKQEPNSSDFYYCESYKTAGKKRKRKKKTGKTSERISALSTNTAQSTSKGATAVSSRSSSVESLSELMETLTLDDLYPTSTPDDEREIVEVGVVDCLQEPSYQRTISNTLSLPNSSR